LEHACEKYKIDLATKIGRWDLNSESYEKIEIRLPQNAYSNEPWIANEFYAHQLREVFVTRVWANKLKAVVKRVLDRASGELAGKSIGISLVSGGSANLGWLRTLLREEFSEQLQYAEPVNVHHSFQQIVANGLAIECARRFYNDESEFVAVTYNPIKLALGTESDDLAVNLRYHSENDVIDMRQAKPGDLIPSAQSLKHFFDKPLRWKVKLPKSPKRKLEYFFSRPNEVDEEGTKLVEFGKSVYNVEQNVLHTRNSRHFDNRTIVELLISEDGTVRPKFIYKSAHPERDIHENSENGQPFYIDMTTDTSETNEVVTNYIGFDFGTSSSSICHLTKNDINVTNTREASNHWRNITDAVHSLPYPVAVTVRDFLNPQNADKQAEFGRAVFDSCLAMLSYSLAAEVALNQNFSSSIRQLQHRSLGPLKALLKTACEALKWKSRKPPSFRQSHSGTDRHKT
jgi:hypothetical protein